MEPPNFSAPHTFGNNRYITGFLLLGGMNQAINQAYFGQRHLLILRKWAACALRMTKARTMERALT